jgi:hypothetical protein
MPRTKRLVRVKSLEWYESNQNEDGEVDVPCLFVFSMRNFCGLLCYATNRGRTTEWHDKEYDIYNLEIAWDKYPLPERNALKKMLKDIEEDEDEDVEVSDYSWSEMMFDFVKERKIIKI